MLRRRNSTQQVDHSQIYASASGQTVTAIKDFARRIDDDLLTGIVHKQRVRKFCGLPDYEIPPGILKELSDAGFIWVVDTSFVRRFRYHAAVGADHQWHDHRVFIKQGRLRQAVVYQGDIPEFALERAEIAGQIGINNFTIHSMLPLPVSFILTDPVLIGWLALPSIEIRNFGKHHQEVYFSVEDITGIVIAAWDVDRELEV